MHFLTSEKTHHTMLFTRVPPVELAYTSLSSMGVKLV